MPMTVVTISKSLQKKAALYAAREGVSLEEFVLEKLAERVGRDQVMPPPVWIIPGPWISASTAQPVRVPQA